MGVYSEEFLYLIEETSGSACYVKLKARFKTTTFTRHIELHKTFYNAEHDPSKPIEIDIHKVIYAKAQLTAMGHEVNDIEVKDIILMNLHSAYETIKLSLFTQLTKPSLNVIRSILTSSSPIIDVPFAVKSEGTEMALATKFGRSSNDRKGGPGNLNVTCRNDIGCPGHHHNKSEGGIEDSKGFRWGDVTSENCHRCSRKGHIAALCVADMPPDIKSRILGESPTRDKESSYICNSAFHHSHSPPSHHVSLCANSHSPSPTGSCYNSS
jgi:hypothetical protein